MRGQVLVIFVEYKYRGLDLPGLDLPLHEGKHFVKPCKFLLLLCVLVLYLSLLFPVQLRELLHNKWYQNLWFILV